MTDTTDSPEIPIDVKLPLEQLVKVSVKGLLVGSREIQYFDMETEQVKELGCGSGGDLTVGNNDIYFTDPHIIHSVFSGRTSQIPHMAKIFNVRGELFLFGTKGYKVMQKLVLNDGPPHDLFNFDKSENLLEHRDREKAPPVFEGIRNIFYGAKGEIYALVEYKRGFGHGSGWFSAIHRFDPDKPTLIGEKIDEFSEESGARYQAVPFVEKVTDSVDPFATFLTNFPDGNLRFNGKLLIETVHPPNRAPYQTPVEIASLTLLGVAGSKVQLAYLDDGVEIGEVDLDENTFVRGNKLPLKTGPLKAIRDPALHQRLMDYGT